MTILQSPEQVSLSMNILPFRLSSTEQVSLILLHGEDEILSQLYEPDADNIVEIDLRDIVHNRLSVLLFDSSEAYIQPNLVGDFTAIFGTDSYNFRVIRGGVENLADSSTNFLMQNFLTWQPTLKKVTYSTPEFLTYYSQGVMTMVLKAYYVAADGTITDDTINYASLLAGKAYTIPMQYAIVSSKLGSKFPSYYDVWVENSDGNRVTYVQRYQADNAKSLHEDWILFENSLGGIDTFRAYGVDVMTAKHTHNVAEIAEESIEYRVDTERLHQKNTGYLLPAEARWLYDFFPSSRKYIYVENTIRSIVVTESDVKRNNKLLPTGYTFTYKFADARPLLNLPRTDVPATMLDIQVPELGSFSLPPRLVEIPRLPLTEGALFPAQSPYSEEWGTTTVAALAAIIGKLLSQTTGSTGGVGHGHDNLELLAAFSYVEQYLLVHGEKIKAGYADEAKRLSDISELLRLFLRKDQPDTAAHTITFNDGHISKGDVIIGEEGYASGLTGFGTKFDRYGNGEMSSLSLRHELRVPSLVYNQVEIITGEKWNSPGGGKIERVAPDIDASGNYMPTGTLWLKLEPGQIGAVYNNAICMGIFHDWEEPANNATDDLDDSRGNRTFAGFTTAYFTITEVSDYTDENGVEWANKQCRYQIRPVSSRWSGQAHPYPDMTFTCYGIFSDNPELLNKYGHSIYETRSYTRQLWKQNTWEISAANIALQLGDLSNLNVHGMDMTGHSAYLNSVYFTGQIKQVKPDGSPILIANDRGDWQSGMTADYYDRFSFNGGLWLCINESGTNSQPDKNDPSWLLQVESGSSVNAASRWNTADTPYPINTILTFAGKIWISNKETSEPPFPIYTDKDGHRLTYKDGGYVLVWPLVQSADWNLLLDAAELVDGADGESLQVRYSSDMKNWHQTFVTGDLWMQQRVGEDSQWSDAIKIVGEGKDGADGKDGSYTNYEFAVNDSIDVAPTTGWQDAPPPVGSGQYLWMRMQVVNPNTGTATSWHTARIGGEQGDSITQHGRWKTGMVVPALGVVTMGGKAWVAKVATSNPPMWCYTDKDGCRLTYKDGGYVLTGEINSVEYDLMVENGKDGQDGVNGQDGKDGIDGKDGADGKDGVDGKDGADGKQGIQGCIIRDSEWALGTEYRNDENLTTGTRYIDVVLVRNNAATTGWDAYKCKQTHTSSAATAPGNTTYWEEFGANVTTIFTSLIIAKNAKIQFLQGNQLLICKDDGSVTAGMSGSVEGKKVRFWAGKDMPDDAPFRVTEDGFVYAEQADVRGDITVGSLSYKTNYAGGSMVGYGLGFGGNDFVLPPIDGKFKEVKFFAPQTTRILIEINVTVADATQERIMYLNQSGVMTVATNVTLGSNKLYTLSSVPIATGSDLDGEYYWFLSAQDMIKL